MTWYFYFYSGLLHSFFFCLNLLNYRYTCLWLICCNKLHLLTLSIRAMFLLETQSDVTFVVIARTSVLFREKARHSKVTPCRLKCIRLLPSITDLFVHLSLQNSILALQKKYQPPSILALKAKILIFKKILYYKRVFKHISFMGNIVWKAS